MVGGILLFRQVRPAVHENPDSAAQTQIASAVGPSRRLKPTQSMLIIVDNADQAPPDVAGKWKATVKYDWGATYAETFDFEVDGHELSGTASFLETDRGIFDGKIKGRPDQLHDQVPDRAG